MPVNAAEAVEAAEAIASGNAGHWGNLQQWPEDRVRAGDWTPVQWYDGALAEATWELERHAFLEPAGARYRIGPDGRSVQDAYEIGDEDAPGAVPGFHSVSGAVRRTMWAEPDVWYVPRRRPRRNMERWIEQSAGLRGHFLVPMRFDTISGRLTGLWSALPSFGWWVPVAVPDEDQQKALAVWWNSTPVRLMLLNRRAQKLTYPTWQLAHLREVRIPRPGNPAWPDLRAAFDKVGETELVPMKQAERCEAREIIDQAAALACGLDPDLLGGLATSSGCGANNHE